MELIWAKPTDIQMNPLNPRRHPERQQRALSASLAELGWIAPLVVNRRTGRLIDGELRLKVALERAPNDPVPAVYVDLSPQDEARALAAFDYIGSMATFDASAIGALLASIGDNSGALADVFASLGREWGGVIIAPPEGTLPPARATENAYDKKKVGENPTGHILQWGDLMFMMPSDIYSAVNRWVDEQSAAHGSRRDAFIALLQAGLDALESEG